MQKWISVSRSQFICLICHELQRTNALAQRLYMSNLIPHEWVHGHRVGHIDGSNPSTCSSWLSICAFLSLFVFLAVRLYIFISTVSTPKLPSLSPFMRPRLCSRVHVAISPFLFSSCPQKKTVFAGFASFSFSQFLCFPHSPTAVRPTGLIFIKKNNAVSTLFIFSVSRLVCNPGSQGCWGLSQQVVGKIPIWTGHSSSGNHTNTSISG